MIRWRGTLPLAALALALLLPACGGEEVLAPDEDLADLVGDWRATRFEVTNVADPSVSPDLIDPSIGASFTLNIQPSGQYTAILTFQQHPLTEIGELTRAGDKLVMRVLQPCCRTDRVDYSLEAGVLSLSGPTEFDFNNDGEPEDATAAIDLVRR
ncbi:MAG: hypothetical protein KY453_02440 [Gemmatimonadetes bacterium]|nr:hypothetical protein [Gemmatimonadota bacterium]